MIHADRSAAMKKLALALVKSDPTLDDSQLLWICTSDVPFDSSMAKERGNRTEGNVGDALSLIARPWSDMGSAKFWRDGDPSPTLNHLTF